MPTLETLAFDNAFARLPPAFYTRLEPEPLTEPYLVAASPAAAALIGPDATELARPEFPQVFAGNLLMPGSEPLAAVYSGHQFGVWAGQLGDGRAHLLGEIAAAGSGWEIQLKGAGQTLKQGTLIKSIRLTGDPQEIDCRYPGIKGLVLRAEFVRKR